MAVRLAICFGLGKLPAPGTWGSIPGLVLGALCALFLSPWATLLALFLLTVVTYVSIAVTEATWHTHDDSRIVIDEVLGCAIAVAFLSPGLFHWLLGFALFRIFDIVKPGPIGYIDKKMASSFATMLDDMVAGVCAGLCLWLISFLGL